VAGNKVSKRGIILRHCLHSLHKTFTGDDPALAPAAIERTKLTASIALVASFDRLFG
jgi:hypothetical protein